MLLLPDGTLNMYLKNLIVISFVECFTLTSVEHLSADIIQEHFSQVLPTSLHKFYANIEALLSRSIRETFSGGLETFLKNDINVKNCSSFRILINEN